MNPDPLVHVLIINWNGTEHLKDCFDSLLASPYQNAKFILLDNNSEDNSVTFVRENYSRDPRVDFHLLTENLGWSRANNEGMRAALEAKADYILLLNNDTRVEPDFLENLVDQAESDPEIGALSPKILMFDDPQIINSVGLQASIIGAAWDKGIGRLDTPEWDTDDPIIGVCGAAMFLRTSALEKSGLLPDDFDIYLDDLDLCLRIWNAGYTIKLCCPSIVYHKFSATMGEGKRARHKYYLNTRNRFRIVFRNFSIHILPWAIIMIKISEIRAFGRAILDGDFWKIPLHIKAAFSIWAYFPKAFSHRRSQKLTGNFQKLILNKPLFFPGTTFPENGWYPPITINGTPYTPMTATATYDHKGGDLNIRATNPCSETAQTQFTITQSDKTIATLDDTQNKNITINPEPGTLIFHASTFIPPHQTGLLYDIGGWISITPTSGNTAQ